MDYSSMVESLDKMLKATAAGKACLQPSDTELHPYLRSHSSATSPMVDGVPLLIQSMSPRPNLNAAPHSLSRN